MKQPLVSIITPCFNMAHCVSHLLDSVLIQKYRPLEMILVDDGSTDHIAEIVQKYWVKFEENQIRFIYHRQDNQGLAGAINAGLGIMKGDYFIWPDADDYLEPDSIQKRVEVLAKNPECAVVTGQAYVRQHDHLETYVRILKENNQNQDRKVQFERMLNGDALFCPGTHMVCKKKFLEVNPQCHIFQARRGQNWQLLLPLYYAYPRAFLDEPVYNYVVFPNSMSQGDDTEERILQRYDEHETILNAVLDMIETVQKVNLKPYRTFLLDKYAKLRMQVAITYKDRKLFDFVFSEKQRMTGLDYLDLVNWVRIRYPILEKPMRLCYRVLRRGEGLNSAAECLLTKLDNAHSEGEWLPEAKVSVLIACYNGGQYLRRCMECLLEQSYRMLEIIVVNDGSTDGSEEILCSFEQSFEKAGMEYLHVYQKNQGAAAAVQTALTYAHGDYLMVYDVDDILFRDAVYDKVRFLEKHREHDMVRSNGFYIFNPDKPGRLPFTSKKRMKKDIFDDLIDGKANNWPSTYMVKSDAFYKANGGRSIYVSKYGQNLQFMLPLAYQSKVGFIEKPLMGYYIHQDSHSHYGGIERTLEKCNGYAMNRIEILKRMRMSTDEREKYIKRIEDSARDACIHFAISEKNKDYYEKYMKEQPVPEACSKIKWILGTSRFETIRCFTVKCWNKLQKESGSIIYNIRQISHNARTYL